MIEVCRNCCGGVPPGGGQYLPEACLGRRFLMKTGSRILTVLVALALLATGPLAPLAAAQQPTPTTPTTPPPQQPMPSAQPAPEPVVQQPQDIPEQESRLAESAAYNVGAGVANVFYIPGKALLCGLGGAVGIFILF